MDLPTSRSRAIEHSLQHPPTATRRQREARRSAILGFGSCLVYVFAVFFCLRCYPIYFFCDESVQANEAESILANGRDTDGRRFPLFFRGLGEFQHSLTIYLQLPFSYALGETEEAVRARNAVASLVGVLALMWAVGRANERNCGFLLPLFFASSPIWFLHARTGFEALVACSFHLAFLAFYSVGRAGSWRAAVAAGLFAAAAFYSYIPARGWSVISVSLLASIDVFRDRTSRRQALFLVSAFLAALIPAAAAMYTNPSIAFQRLDSVGFSAEASFDPGFLEDAALRYLQALDPRFWFTWEGTFSDLFHARHVIPELAQIPPLLGVLSAVGIARAAWRPGDPLNRALLISLFVAPLPSAPFGINNVRLMLVGAVLIVFAYRGLEAVVLVVPKHRLASAIAFAAWAAGVGYTSWLVGYALTEAPRRHSDYGFYGVQFGAMEVGAWLRARSPLTEDLYWGAGLFNANDSLISFYLDDEDRKRVHVRSPRDLCFRDDVTFDDAIWILRRDWRASVDGCPLEMKTLESLHSPSGDVEIVIGRIRRKEDYAEWHARWRRDRTLLKRYRIEHPHISPWVRASSMDGGSLQAAFDGDVTTLARSREINPALLRFSLRERPARALRVTVSHNRSVRCTLSVIIQGEVRKIAEANIIVKRPVESVELSPTIPLPASTPMQLTVQATDAGEFGVVHINEVTPIFAP